MQNHPAVLPQRLIHPLKVVIGNDVDDGSNKTICFEEHLRSLLVVGKVLDEWKSDLLVFFGFRQHLVELEHVELHDCECICHPPSDLGKINIADVFIVNRVEAGRNGIRIGSCTIERPKK